MSGTLSECCRNMFGASPLVISGFIVAVMYVMEVAVRRSVRVEINVEFSFRFGNNHFFRGVVTVAVIY
jgi:hypothetical protein